MLLHVVPSRYWCEMIIYSCYTVRKHCKAIVQYVKHTMAFHLTTRLTNRLPMHCLNIENTKQSSGNFCQSIGLQITYRMISVGSMNLSTPRTPGQSWTRFRCRFGWLEPAAHESERTWCKERKCDRMQ